MNSYLFLLCVLYIIANNIGFCGWMLLACSFVFDRLMWVFRSWKENKDESEPL